MQSLLQLLTSACSRKAATDAAYMNERGCVLMKLEFQTQMVGQRWPVGQSVPTPESGTWAQMRGQRDGKADKLGLLQSWSEIMPWTWTWSPSSLVQILTSVLLVMELWGNFTQIISFDPHPNPVRWTLCSWSRGVKREGSMVQELVSSSSSMFTCSCRIHLLKEMPSGSRLCDSPDSRLLFTPNFLIKLSTFSVLPLLSHTHSVTLCELASAPSLQKSVIGFWSRDTFSLLHI